MAETRISSELSNYLVTAILPLPRVLANPSAICDRAEFFLQTNITRFI